MGHHASCLAHIWLFISSLIIIHCSFDWLAAAVAQISPSQSHNNSQIKIWKMFYSPKFPNGGEATKRHLKEFIRSISLEWDRFFSLSFFLFHYLMSSKYLWSAERSLSVKYKNLISFLYEDQKYHIKSSPAIC